MHVLDILRGTKEYDITRDEIQSFLRYFKIPFKQIEISPLVKILSTQSLNQGNSSTRFPMTDANGSFSLSASGDREYYFGDIFVSDKAIFTATPYTYSMSEVLVQPDGTSRIHLFDRLISVSDSVFISREFKERFFNRLEVTWAVEAISTVSFNFKFVGLKITLK